MKKKKVSKVSTNEQWWNSFKFCSFNLEIKITKVIQVEIIQTWVFDFYNLLLTWLVFISQNTDSVYIPIYSPLKPSFFSPSNIYLTFFSQLFKSWLDVAIGSLNNQLCWHFLYRFDKSNDFVEKIKSTIENHQKNNCQTKKIWLHSLKFCLQCIAWSKHYIVVSKYSLDRVLNHEFLHFDTRTRSYSSSFHKTSNEWGEF